MKCIYKNRLGASGELLAKNFLIEKNYKFIKSNYRFERVEIDIIVEDVKNKMLIFTEVKTRKNKKFGEPEESITPLKQEHIKKAAMGFISLKPEYEKHDLRIDVVSILFEDGKPVITHIENAF